MFLALFSPLQEKKKKKVNSLSVFNFYIEKKNSFLVLDVGTKATNCKTFFKYTMHQAAVK